MMEKNLQFLIMVETEYSRAELIKLLISELKGAIPYKLNSLDYNGNWIEIWSNEEADSKLAMDKITGYQFFKWRLEVTPMKNGITEKKQVILSKYLKTYLESFGCKCVICANFEHLL